MATHRAVYDPKQRETPEFKNLYNRYHSCNSSKYREAFATFQEFYDWSMANGFVIEARLSRIDDNKPYSPGNIRWTLTTKDRTALYGEERKEMIERWNKTVNRIRIHYGLKPL